jgi:hypothetical protein
MGTQHVVFSEQTTAETMLDLVCFTRLSLVFFSAHEKKNGRPHLERIEYRT